MDTAKSTVRGTPKPNNVFYVWYTELCRRLNCTPAPAVKPAKPKCQTVLNFIADRLKVEEWNPIISALRHDTSLHVISIKGRISNNHFLHDVDTEEKAKHMKRRFGSLWTAYILQQLLKSLSNSIKQTQVLTCLELDGLPMFSGYIEPLLQALKKNRTLKTLSFSNSPIDDPGCQLVCGYLRFTPNVEVINLSGCGLTSKAGEYIAKLIKYQQINRYCESWHNSLRYEDPHTANMRGLKRITLNHNPEFGDAGLELILEELQDDLWMKALDLQICGLTNNVAQKLLDTVDYSKSLEIVDVRHNELLDADVVEKVLQLLKNKFEPGRDPEFQWCNTPSTVMWNSVCDSVSRFSLVTEKPLQKTKSAPMKPASAKPSMMSNALVRKSKTVDNIRGNNNCITDPDYNRKLSELNTKLRTEVQKRKEIEKRNEELKQQLERIQSTIQITHSNKSDKKMAVSEDKKDGSRKCAKTIAARKSRKDECKSVKSEGKALSKDVSPVMAYKNGYSNGFNPRILDSACKIFKTILNNEKPVEEDTDNEDFNHYLIGRTSARGGGDGMSGSISDSDVSLYRYMEEIRHSELSPAPNCHTSNCTSKYGVKKKQKR